MNEDKSFKLHLDAALPAGSHHLHVEPLHQEKPDQLDEIINEKRDFKTLIKDAARQIAASLIILIIGFLALNWSAYYQIAQSKWNTWFGSQENSPLIQLVEKKAVITDSSNLQTSTNLSIQKKQIPPLDMDIAPPDDRIIIPRINQNIPIVKISSDYLIKRDWNGLEGQMQKALQDGVVHYPGTSLPGQTGNVVITGHSSYFPWDPGRFKDVFAVLDDVNKGDRIVIYFNQDKYTYEVFDKKITSPEDISVLKQTPDNRITLITCTPVGTNINRLIVTAKLVAINEQLAK